MHVSYAYTFPNPRVLKFITKALDLAEFSDCPKRHGCVIVKGGTVVGRGWNKHRNHPLNVSPEHVKAGCSMHAEADALRDAGASARGATLYVARRGAECALMSRPCDRCYLAAIEAGISEIYHT